MAPAHALLLLGATADLFCALVKPEDKVGSDTGKPSTNPSAADESHQQQEEEEDADDDEPSPAAPNYSSSKEALPRVKISPSCGENDKRKPSISDFSFKQKLSSFDSLSQHKVSRSGSQTKRKVSPSDALPLSRMSVSEPRFQRRISLTEMPHGQVMYSRSVPIRPPPTDHHLSTTRGSQMHSMKQRPAYQFRSLSTEIPPSCSLGRQKQSGSSSHNVSESELKTSNSDLSPCYQVRNVCKDSS